jgi:hypothetical protein
VSSKEKEKFSLILQGQRAGLYGIEPRKPGTITIYDCFQVSAVLSGFSYPIFDLGSGNLGEEVVVF